MPRIDLPTERQVGHLTLLRQGRKISLQEYNALSADERLEMIRLSRGKQKYDLLLSARDAEQLVLQLHPQELYLTVNELGPEYASELLMLADADQITTLLDLDCWNGDSLSPVLSLHWLALLLETGPEKVCQLAGQIELELLALFLKKHLTIIRGLEVYDDDDAENARRLESLYDIEYVSEDAGKIIGAFLQILAQNDQETYLRLMETIRSETTTVLEEEVYQARSNRLLDLGFVPLQEARIIYSYVDPESFVAGDKTDFTLEGEELPHPGALLAQAAPKNLLAEILSGNNSHALATELCLLANRKMSADRTDVSAANEVTAALQSLYNTLNLALEYLAGMDIARAESIFRTTYLMRLFQLGHSLLLKRQQRSQALRNSPIGPFLDYPEQLFLDALIDQPPALYREASADKPSDLQPITSLKDLELSDLRLEQLENLQQLFCEQLPFRLPEPIEETDDTPTLSILFLTAVANQLLGRPFAPTPVGSEDLYVLKAQTLIGERLSPEFLAQIHSLVEQLAINCGFFVEFCLSCWLEDFASIDPEAPVRRGPFCLLVKS